MREAVINIKTVKGIKQSYTTSLGLEKLMGKIEFDIQRNKNISKEFYSKSEIKKYLGVHSELYS